MKLFKALTTFVAVTATAFGQSTIVGVAEGDARFTKVLELLELAGLKDTFDGPDTPEYTLFAPVNDAFTPLGSKAIALQKTYNSDLLKSVLEHHALQGELTETDLTNTPTQTTLNTEDITADIAGGPSVTSAAGTVANITKADAQANNGVVHIIDSVLLPNGLPLYDTVYEVAAGSTLQVAVDSITGLQAKLEEISDAGYTVLAPTNEAFKEAFAVLKVTEAEFLADSANVKKVLEYHVIPSSLFEADVIAEAGSSVQTVQGDTVAITAGPLVNGISVNQTDIRAFNGVVHTINGVLLPPAEDSSASSAPVSAIAAAISATIIAAFA